MILILSAAAICCFMIVLRFFKSARAYRFPKEQIRYSKTNRARPPFETKQNKIAMTNSDLSSSI